MLEVLAFAPTISVQVIPVERDGITLNGQPVLGEQRIKFCESYDEYAQGKFDINPCAKCVLATCPDGDDAE